MQLYKDPFWWKLGHSLSTKFEDPRKSSKCEQNENL